MIGTLSSEEDEEQNGGNLSKEIFNKKMFILFFSLGCCGLNFMLFSPFLPLVVQDRGYNTIWVGYIIAAYPFAQLISSIIMGKYIYKIE